MRDLLKVSEKEQRCTRELHKISWKESCSSYFLHFSFSAIFQCVRLIPLSDWKEFSVDSCVLPVFMKDQKKYAEVGVLDQILEVWVCYRFRWYQISYLFLTFSIKKTARVLIIFDLQFMLYIDRCVRFTTPRACVLLERNRMFLLLFLLP